MKQQTQIVKKTSKKTVALKPSVAHKAADRAEFKHQFAQGNSGDERHRMITEMAYLIAEHREFQGDRAMDDWLQAEAAVDARIAAKH